MNSTVNLQKINEAMNCISISNVLVDAALVEVNDQLVLASGGASVSDYLEDQDLNRASAICAMALVGVFSGLMESTGLTGLAGLAALTGLTKPKGANEASDLEALMVGVDFLDDDDLLAAKVVKGVMLDCLMAEWVSGASKDESAGVKSLKSDVAQILQLHGYAGLHFSASAGADTRISV